MPRDTRTVKGAVLLYEDGANLTLTNDHDPDEVAARLSPQMLERLKAEGVLEGEWEAKGEEPEPMPGSELATARLLGREEQYRAEQARRAARRARGQAAPAKTPKSPAEKEAEQEAVRRAMERAGKGGGAADDLDATVPELREIAEREGVELESGAHKADIQKAIRKARKAKE